MWNSRSRAKSTCRTGSVIAVSFRCSGRPGGPGSGAGSRICHTVTAEGSGIEPADSRFGPAVVVYCRVVWIRELVGTVAADPVCVVVGSRGDRKWRTTVNFDNGHADLQDGHSGLGLEQLGHPADDVRLADRLSVIDRQGTVVVGMLDEVHRHESLARDRRHRGEHAFVAQPPGAELALDHREASRREPILRIRSSVWQPAHGVDLGPGWLARRARAGAALGAGLGVGAALGAGVELAAGPLGLGLVLGSAPEPLGLALGATLGATEGATLGATEGPALGTGEGVGIGVRNPPTPPSSP